MFFAVAIHLASMSVTSVVELGLEVFELTMQTLELVLGGIEPVAGCGRASAAAGGTAGAAEDRAEHPAAAALATEQPTEDRAGCRQHLLVAATLALGVENLGAVLGRLDLGLQAGDLVGVLAAERSDLLVGQIVGRSQASGREVVAALAGTTVQLHVAIRLQVDGARPAPDGRSGRARLGSTDALFFTATLGSRYTQGFGASGRRSRSS